MSDEHIQSVRIYVTTNEGRPYETDAIVETRDELRLAIARLAAQIEDELDEHHLLDGAPITVEQDDPDSSTVITAAKDVDLTLTQCCDDTALWLPNDDGHGDGSRVYADQLSDTLAVINRAAAIIHERAADITVGQSGGVE